MQIVGNRFKVVLNPHLLSVLRSHRLLFSLRPGVDRLKPGDVLQGWVDSEVEPYSCVAAGLGFYRKMGFASYSNSALDPGVMIGRYCSIAPNVRILGPNHPMDRLSTHTFTYQSNISLLQAVREDFGGGFDGRHPKPAGFPTGFPGMDMPEIGHDVWIGQDVLLARGIRIGHGAIVAGGSLVVKDVPEYAIVGGNPAKLIRYRFDELLRADLLNSAWWSYGFQDFSGMMVNEPRVFLKQLAGRVADGLIQPFQPQRLKPCVLLAERGAGA